jgi:O-acetyl-ADP-ribose deacetylase (regulator of RNase III)
VIRSAHGNVLTAEADALVNTVNTVGVAGKGVALQFRQAFPDNYGSYARAAKRGEVVPGRMFVYMTGLIRPRFIINFPTKRHWRGKSRIQDIREGLRDLVHVLEELDIASVAIPPLGCGNGGLDWAEVRPLIVQALEPLKTEVLLFGPEGAPPAEEMPVATAKPNMTRGRAVLLLLMESYKDPDEFRLSALEVQKLAYFMQVSGEPLRLDYVKAEYGPYAENLNHVLRLIEGHFIRGYGDRSREPKMRLMEGAADEAKAFLGHHEESLLRLESVASLTADWATPYGLELLATVHWAITRPGASLDSSGDLYSYVASWTPRKAHLFKRQQIDRAVAHLEKSGYAFTAAPG